MCVCVSIYLSIYLSMNLSMRTCYVCMYVYMHGRVCVFMVVCMYVCMYACICMYACVYICMYACMYLRTPCAVECAHLRAAHRCSAALDAVRHHLVEAGSPSMQAHLEATAQPSARSCVHIAVICDQTVFNHLFFKKKNNNENFKIEYSRINFQCET